jgi:hypothetical protein
MKDGVAAARHRSHLIWIPDVAEHRLDIGLEIAQPTDRALAGVSRQRAYVRPAAQELFDEVASNEAPGTGY